ncbi:MAG: ABC transporter permease [Saprospiraceae bacterium]|nr:ABC transporter permease [Saprospiraceae bacterium]
MMKMNEGWRTFFSEIGDMTRFANRFFYEGARPRYEWEELLRQCYKIGNKSLPLVGLTGFILGLVLTIQLRPNMAYYGVESKLPDMVAIAIVREIGPVLTALVFAGKISSSIGAELGSMRVTEQIDAMEVSGTNPFKYLVVTRIIATTLMLPILTLLSDAISLYGCYLGVNIRDIVSFGLFYRQVFDALSFSDVIPAFIKTFFFGFAVGLVGCYKGYHSQKGTEGVGRSANSAVVVSSLLIFILDLVAVQVTDILGIN